METDDRTRSGQAVYTPTILRFYDWFVLGFSNRVLWRCPTAELQALYDRNVSGRHLDVGVGTGYFLDKSRWPVPRPLVTLVDLNANSLEAAARRIARFAPTRVVADILKPLPIEPAFDSVGLCYLLHCLPGRLSEKAVVFDHLLPLMSEGAAVFGATIVQGDVPRSRAAQAMMNLYNRKGIFSNSDDRLEDLEIALEIRFDDVRLTQSGSVVKFEARKPSVTTKPCGS